MFNYYQIENNLIKSYVDPFYSKNSFIRALKNREGVPVANLNNKFEKNPNLNESVIIDNSFTRTLPGWTEFPVPDAPGPKVFNNFTSHGLPNDAQFFSQFSGEAGIPTINGNFDYGFLNNSFIFLIILLGVAYYFLKK